MIVSKDISFTAMFRDKSYQKENEVTSELDNLLKSMNLTRADLLKLMSQVSSKMTSKFGVDETMSPSTFGLADFSDEELLQLVKRIGCALDDEQCVCGNDVNTVDGRKYRLEYTYYASTDTCEVEGWCSDTGYSEPTGTLEIPSTIAVNGSEKDVTSIADAAFLKCTGLLSVVIPNSITSIGKMAFFQCTGLTSIIIPDCVVFIDDVAFSECTGLVSLTTPDGIKSIGEGVFYGCTGLSSVTISNEVISGSEGTFSKCTGLLSVTISGGIRSIGRSLFSECTGLTSIIIPGSVESIGEYAFLKCTGLTSIKFETTSFELHKDCFNLGSHNSHVTCTVYSDRRGKFLEPYGGQYTQFNYRPIKKSRWPF